MTTEFQSRADQRTADAFATSWNNLPCGSIYTAKQFQDWMAPLAETDVAGSSVLELGCGNGSLLVHMAGWRPAYLEAVDLGDSVSSATRNMEALPFNNWQVVRGDLTTYRGRGFDLVYCIGVLHHLKDPKAGFDAVVANVKPGGRFHCWVYAREGNAVVRHVVEPLRRLGCRLPWWLTKYCIATPLAVPFFFYAKTLSVFPGRFLLRWLPLYAYCQWVAERDFSFFRHVAFDQLVTPHTAYFDRETLQAWLASHPEIDPPSTYIQMRNGNSWKFGGRVKR